MIFYAVTAYRVRIVGKGVSREDSKVRPVPRLLTAFVGRLHIDTTKEEMVDFLSMASIVEPSCKKLFSKGKSFKTSFMVSCSVSSHDLFYDEELWPSGCELRGWVFYERKDHSAQKGASVQKDLSEMKPV